MIACKNLKYVRTNDRNIQKAIVWFLHHVWSNTLFIINDSVIYYKRFCSKFTHRVILFGTYVKIFTKHYFTKFTSAFSNRRIIIAWNLEYKIVTSRLGELTLIAVSFVVRRRRAYWPRRPGRTDHYSTMWSTICSSVGKCTQFIDSNLNNIRNRFMHTCAYSPLFIRNNDLKYTIRTSLTKLKNIMRFWHLSLISWFFPNTQYILLTILKTKEIMMLAVMQQGYKLKLRMAWRVNARLDSLVKCSFRTVTTTRLQMNIQILAKYSIILLFNIKVNNSIWCLDFIT